MTGITASVLKDMRKDILKQFIESGREMQCDCCGNYVYINTLEVVNRHAYCSECLETRLESHQRTLQFLMSKHVLSS